VQVIDTLNNKNFELYAFRNYNNPQCVEIEEFHEDVNRFKYLKKLLNRHLQKGDLKDRIIMNHVITIMNVFGNDAGMRMLIFKLDEEHYPVIKPFLLHLGYLRHNDMVSVGLDPKIVQAIRNEHYR
jgi:hypothetical protein